MKRLLVILLLMPLGVTADGPPSSGGGYTIESWTVDGGGGESLGGTYEMRGTIAQHDADLPLSGGDFELQGGFWPGTNNPRQTLFRDSFE